MVDVAIAELLWWAHRLRRVLLFSPALLAAALFIGMALRHWPSTPQP
ncbi:hypothetical protein ACFPIF_18895 [Brevundimonas faecalis]